MRCRHGGQEFYFDRRVRGQRPHVFGMTASPLDTKVGQNASAVRAFFRELETNLNARVRPLLLSAGPAQVKVQCAGAQHAELQVTDHTPCQHAGAIGIRCMRQAYLMRTSARWMLVP